MIAAPAALKWSQWALLGAIAIPGAFLFAGAFWLAGSEVRETLASPAPTFMGPFFAVISIALLVLPPVLAILAVVPVRLKRNVRAIRWNFLYRILYKRTGRLVPASWTK